MTYLGLVKAFLIALPELIRLIRIIEAKQKELVKAEQIKADIGAINEAFETKDPDALSRLFNS